MNVILTNYFTSKQDPQKGKHSRKKISMDAGFVKETGKWSDNSEKLISPWIDSLSKFQLNGIIFHDGLSKKFIKKMENDYVKFQHYEISTNWSLNDERFVCWYKWLEKNKNIDFLYNTDLFDVVFNKNPFDLITNDYDIYTGMNQNRAMKKSTQISKRMIKKYGKIYHEDKKDASAGIIGGNRENMLKLYKRIIKEFEFFGNNKNNNMIVYNKCLYDLFDEKRVLNGPPVSSVYRKYQKNGNFAISHK